MSALAGAGDAFVVIEAAQRAIEQAQRGGAEVIVDHDAARATAKRLRP